MKFFIIAFLIGVISHPGFCQDQSDVEKLRELSAKIDVNLNKIRNGIIESTSGNNPKDESKFLQAYLKNSKHANEAYNQLKRFIYDYDYLRKKRNIKDDPNSLKTSDIEILKGNFTEDIPLVYFLAVLSQITNKKDLMLGKFNY